MNPRALRCLESVRKIARETQDCPHEGSERTREAGELHRQAMLALKDPKDTVELRVAEQAVIEAWKEEKRGNRDDRTEWTEAGENPENQENR